MTAQTSHSGENGAHKHALTHSRTRVRAHTPGTQASESRRHQPSLLRRTGLFSPGGSGKEKWRKHQRGKPTWPHRKNNVLKAGFIYSSCLEYHYPLSSSEWPRATPTLLPWDQTSSHSAATRPWTLLGEDGVGPFHTMKEVAKGDKGKVHNYLSHGRRACRLGT